MTDLIKLLNNNVKYAVYTGGNINGLYSYLEMILSSTKWTTSGQLSRNFGHSSSVNNDTAFIQPNISALRMIQKSICKCCGRIGHNADSWIIHVPKFSPPSLRRNMNQFNVLHGEETNNPLIDFNIQPPEAHFKSRTYPPKTSPVVLYIMGRLNHHVIDNGDVEVQHLEFPV